MSQLIWRDYAIFKTSQISKIHYYISHIVSVKAFIGNDSYLRPKLISTNLHISRISKNVEFKTSPFKHIR